MGILQATIWSGLPCPPPGDLPNPGIEPGSPALQADSMPAEPAGKPLGALWPLLAFSGHGTRLAFLVGKNSKM